MGSGMTGFCGCGFETGPGAVAGSGGSGFWTRVRVAGAEVGTRLRFWSGVVGRDKVLPTSRDGTEVGL